MKYHLCFSSEENKAERVPCSLCHRDTINSEATKWCKTCKDPEPLCDQCVQLHTHVEANEEEEDQIDVKFQQFLNRTSEE